MVGSFVSYSIAMSVNHSGYKGPEGWQILFLSTGAFTVLCGVLFLFMIPDSPSSAWFLSREEKVMVFERIRSNQQGTVNKTVKKYQVIEALKDPMVLILSQNCSLHY